MQISLYNLYLIHLTSTTKTMFHEMTQNLTPFEEKKLDEEIQDQTKISTSTDTESDKEELNGDVKLGSIANTLIDVT